MDEHKRNVIAEMIGKHYSVPTKSDDNISLEFLTTQDISNRIDTPSSPLEGQDVVQTLTYLGFKIRSNLLTESRINCGV